MASPCDLEVLGMDQKKASAASQEISDLLKEAFEKHKNVCRGYRRVEEELRLLKEASKRDREEIRKLKHDNSDLEEELSEAKARIADLSKDVARLHEEVLHWNRKACQVKRSKPTDSSQHRISQSRSRQSNPAPLTATSSKSDKRPSSGLSNRTLKNGNTVGSVVQEIVLNSDGEELMCDNENGTDEVGAVKQRLFTAGHWTGDSSPNFVASTPKRKRETEMVPETQTQASPSKPLQTNTCKVCERYWRAEDSRAPGAPRSSNTPPCKIHGKHERPPNTPENFWKSARLSPPPSQQF